MIVIGFDPSLSLSGVVVVDSSLTIDGHPAIINTATIKTHPGGKKLTGIKYEEDVMVRAAYIYGSLIEIIRWENAVIFAVESVPFARGWKTGVASGVMKGITGAVWDSMSPDCELVLVDPKKIKTMVRSLSDEKAVMRHKELFSRMPHEQKDFIVAWFAENAHGDESKNSDFEIFPEFFSRAEREAVADAYAIAYYAINEHKPS